MYKCEATGSLASWDEVDHAGVAFFPPGAFQAFDQDGDGTIRLSVLEVRAVS